MKLTKNDIGSIEALFNSFSSLNILVIGDVMLDSYIWGKVDRISPEAPVPVVHVQKREKRLGGAANVALNIKALGANPIVCTVVGDDGEGDEFLTLLKENGICTDYVVKSKDRPTTVKERVIGGTQQMLRIDTEDDKPLNIDEEGELTSKFTKASSLADVVIFQDYDKGVLTSNIIKEVIEWANKNDIPTAVDPKKRNFMHYRQATLFKPNFKELKEGLQGAGFSFPHDNEGNNLIFQATVEKASALLKDILGTKMNLITLSEKGVFIDVCGEGEEEKHWIPAHKRNIADVSGAGDTVISIAAIALALKIPSRMIAELSNLGGGIVCEYSGVVPINLSAFYKEISKVYNGFSEIEKIFIR